MSSVEPVRKEIVIEASREHAFRVFTDGIDRWWPRKHHVGASPMKRKVLEARPGGRWYSICEDGTECDAGKVLTWDPPARLVLSWQLTANWKFDPAFVTEVEVNFVSLGPKRTRVELEHRDLHRFGVAAEELRKQIDSDGGWLLIVKQFGKTAEESET